MLGPAFLGDPDCRDPVVLLGDKVTKKVPIRVIHVIAAAIFAVLGVVIVALAAMSLNLLIGGGGMVALGHAAFVGIGGEYPFEAEASDGVA